jgi:hypothetical protein
METMSSPNWPIFSHLATGFTDWSVGCRVTFVARFIGYFKFPFISIVYKGYLCFRQNCWSLFSHVFFLVVVISLLALLDGLWLLWSLVTVSRDVCWCGTGDKNGFSLSFQWGLAQQLYAISNVQDKGRIADLDNGLFHNEFC